MESPQSSLPVPGYLAPLGPQAAPGVLVLHAWWGLNAFIHSFCNRLAAEGYTVFAPDLYNGRVVDTIPEAEALARALDDDQARRTVQEAVQFLLHHPHTRGDRLGVLGFSLGAAYALELEANVAAAVVYYGTNAAEAIPSRPPLQGHFAEEDPYEPMDDVRALETMLRQRGKSAEFHYYPGTRHWFAETNRPEYHPPSADLAWQRMVAFLRRELG